MPAVFSHRRAVYLLNTPTLTLHLGFRLPPETDPIAQQSEQSADQQRSALVTRLNHCIKNLAGNDTAFPVFEDPSTQGSHSDPFRIQWHQTVRVQMKDHGPFRMNCSIDIHSEYFTFSFEAYLKQQRPSGARDDSLNWPEKALEALEAIERLHRTAELTPGLDRIETDIQADPAIACLFQDFWVHALAKHELLPTPVQNAEKFAHFTGIVIRDTDLQGQISEANKKDNTGAFDQINLASGEYSQNALVRVDGKDGSATISDVNPYTEAKHRLIARANRLSTFISRFLGFRIVNNARSQYTQGSSVFCGFLNGLAIYTSTLSNSQPQQQLAPPGWEDQIRYIILYGGPSRHQLGRLLRRLHIAGECRLAALFDYEDVLDAGSNLRRLEAEVNRVPNPTSEQVLHWRTELNKVASAGRGGLSYRASRSQFYVQALRDRVLDLRIAPIEGWQSYDSFIRRHMNSNFDNIRRVGVRLSDVESRLRRTSSELLGNSIDNFNSNTEKWQLEMQALQSQMADQQRNMNEYEAKLIEIGNTMQSNASATRAQVAQLVQHNSEIAGIQRLGEYLASAALFYYTASGLSGLVNYVWKFTSDTNLFAVAAPSEQDENMVRAASYAIGLLFGFLFIRHRVLRGAGKPFGPIAGLVGKILKRFGEWLASKGAEMSNKDPTTPKSDNHGQH